MEVACGILYYLKGNARGDIFLHADNDLQLYGYCHSHWGACPLSRSSLTGYLVTFEGSPVSLRIKGKQRCLSLVLMINTNLWQ